MLNTKTGWTDSCHFPHSIYSYKNKVSGYTITYCNLVSFLSRCFFTVYVIRFIISLVNQANTEVKQYLYIFIKFLESSTPFGTW